MAKEFKPYVPASESPREFTLKAIILGLIMAAVLGAANAYLGLRAGMTVSAIFPAAIIAIAAFRLPFMKGNILEQNIARTAASVGEALVAGAIFTIPAFVIVEIGGEKLWKNFHYWEATLILLVGGLLGVLFVIILRRTLCIDLDLPFPESYACFELTKAGQKGETGARYIFGAMGIGVLIQLFKDGQGIPIFRELTEFFIKFPKSVVKHFDFAKKGIGDITHGGGVPFATPAASPALIGIGYIIGPRLAAINFSGCVFAYLVLIPLILFLDPALPQKLLGQGTVPSQDVITFSVWYNIVRPIAVGAMLVSAVYTLYKMRSSLTQALKGAFFKAESGSAVKKNVPRTEIDLNLRFIVFFVIILIIPITAIYYYFTLNFLGAIVTAIVMAITAFLLSAVGGYLVGLVGEANQPISGLTLTALLISALVLLAFGITGPGAVAAVLGVSAVVCCATSTGGNMIADLKVGHLLGGTPWKMEVAEIISTAVIAFFLILPIIWLHEANIIQGGIGIGDKMLPAPQAGLMAQLAQGIVGGNMAWGLIVIGMALAFMLIMIKAPAPMLIAVGMYLPFEVPFALFVGGIIKFAFDKFLDRRNLTDKAKEKASNKGVLVASGFIAGEAITGILLAVMVLLGVPSFAKMIFGVESFAFVEHWGGWLSIIIFAVIAYMLIKLPLGKKGK